MQARDIYLVLFIHPYIYLTRDLIVNYYDLFPRLGKKSGIVWTVDINNSLYADMIYNHGYTY